jgi:chemotaxis protein methyltransferase CheR
VQDSRGASAGAVSRGPARSAPEAAGAAAPALAGGDSPLPGERGGLDRLSEASGIQLAAYRSEHVAECVRRALVRENAADAATLAAAVARDEEARTRFRRLVAVSVSGLFRDPAQFDLLERRLLPGLHERSGRISIWSAGCSDGSELYSIAIVLERLGALGRSFLLGSDLLAENLVLARRGRYGEVAISPALRARLRWEQRDLLRDGPPGGAFRVVICRNVAIYLAPAAKHALHEMLAGALARGGVLLLGRSERLGDPAALGLERIVPHAYRRPL